MEYINWYPGHMKKTRELIQENLKLVDMVVEVIDARIPVSSRNPVIDELIKGKRRIIALNKSDLADPAANAAWMSFFERQGSSALEMNSMSGTGAAALIKMLIRVRDQKNEGAVRKKPLRLMIVGVPNAGKSSLINRLTGGKGAKTGNKPGVTRGKQWLKLGEDMQLLDTPGILWPKFEDQNVGKKLAYTGSIKDEILDISTLCMNLIELLSERYPQLLLDRYKIGQIEDTPLETMQAIARKRGFIRSGNEADYERTARTLMDEYRAGKLGRITLEWPQQMNESK